MAKPGLANPYRRLFNAPGAAAFTAAGLVARMPLPMMGIGIITMLSQLRGSYGLAGAVSAAFVLTYALLSPQVSRLVDRRGQRRVLPVATGISVMGVLILVASAHWQLPDWTLFVGAVLTGFMPSMSAMVRARWTALYRHLPELQTAYSLETVLDEISFIAGPPLSVGLGIAAFPQAGPLTAGVLLLVGVLVFVALRSTEPPVSAVEAGADDTAPAIAVAGVAQLVVLMTAMGVIVGSVDIVSVAFAEQQGRPGAASFVLSAYAIGSCLAGLAFGACKLQSPLHRLLLLGGLATAVTTLPFLLIGSMAGLTATVFVAGLVFAPTMIVAMSLVERMVGERRVTEGMTWLLAGLNVGVAIGAVASGHAVDARGVGGGFGVAVAAGVAVSAAVWLASRRAQRYAVPHAGAVGQGSGMPSQQTLSARCEQP
nr:MFS transporter [Cupriavidus gilardii]